VIFASSELYTGAVGGLVGADRLCTAAAMAANLTGRVYRALLSTTIVDASDRVVTDFAFANMEGKMLARNSIELFSGVLRAPVLTSDGAVSGVGPHTGTNSDGSWSSASCSDWTKDDSHAFETVGLPGSVTGSWVADSLCACCQQHRPFLCVQGKDARQIL
jgi:hypothetical protein